MRILVLTLMMSFLSHSAFASSDNGYGHFEKFYDPDEIEYLRQTDEAIRQMDAALRQMEEDRVWLGGRLEIAIRERLATEDDDNVIQELSPFLEAVCEGDIGRVNGFLDSGTEDINQQDLDGATPLIIAATARQYAMCRHLILRGASIEIRTHDGWNIGICARHDRKY